MEPAGAPVEDHDHDREHLLRRFIEAAEEAERQTGRHEETEAEVRRSLTLRLIRTIVGFVVIGLGIAALPLPGPGWLIIIVGLNLLPFSWAERTVRLIRRKVPGVPEEGRLPVHTWIVMVVLTVTVMTISILWGDDLREWASGLV